MPFAEPGVIRRIVFEYVSIAAHPEHYHGDRPCIQPSQVPDGHWTLVDRVGDGVLAQYEGLMNLIAQGELIRDVRLYVADKPAEIVWRQVKP